MDQQPNKTSKKSSANLLFFSLSSCVNALLDAGMFPKQTDAERWIDMLETKVQRKERSCCQACLRILVVVRTFQSTAKQQNLEPLSNDGASQTTWRVKEQGVSSKDER